GPVGVNASAGYGNVGDARSSANTTEHIGCNTYGYAGATSGYTFCWAVDSRNNAAMCSSTDPTIVQASTAITSYSYIVFQFDKTGTCTSLDVQNYSNYSPMVP